MGAVAKGVANGFKRLSELNLLGPGVVSKLGLTASASMGPRSPHWVNTPVLMQALERYEQGLLPRSMQLWIQQLLEIEAPSKDPLRKHSS